MHGATRAEKAYHAGDEVPESGVYAVTHDHHRQKHLATVFKGDRFPACARCGKAVRFVLSRPAALISEDSDFKQGSGPAKRDK